MRFTNGQSKKGNSHVISNRHFRCCGCHPWHRMCFDKALGYRGGVARAVFMSAAVIGAALIAEPTCAVAWVWALVPLPSVQQ